MNLEVVESLATMARIVVPAVDNGELGPCVGRGVDMEFMHSHRIEKKG